MILGYFLNLTKTPLKAYPLVFIINQKFTHASFPELDLNNALTQEQRDRTTFILISLPILTINQQRSKGIRQCR